MNKLHARTLKAVEDFWREHCYPPSVRHLMETLNYRSPTVVHRYLCSLREAGEVTFEDSKSRTIVPKSVRAVLKKGLRKPTS